MNPEVSVIIPTYNSEAYIAQALQSVFDQSYRNWEIIMVDDASSDSTVQLARRFQDKRFKIVENSSNKGVSYSRNRGIKEAKGKWVALLDSDDWYAPQRLEKLLSVAYQQGADLIADDLLLIEDGRKRHWSSLLWENGARTPSSVELIDAVKFVVSDRLPSITAKRNWSLGYTKPLIKREFLLRNNIWYREDVRVGEDFILYLQCLRQKARFYLVTSPYYYYRTREVSLSTRKPTEYLSESCKITQDFIDLEVNSQADADLLEALNDNLTIFQRRLAYYLAIENFQAKKPLQTIRQIIDSPYIVGDLSKKLLVFLNKKTASILKSEMAIYLYSAQKTDSKAKKIITNIHTVLSK